MACGTGAVASAISAYIKSGTDKTSFFIHAPGGDLRVRFEKTGDTFKNIWLEGPAVYVFEGQVEVCEEA